MDLPNFEPLKEEFKKNRAVSITPVLTDKAAKEVHSYYFNKKDWKYVIYPDFIPHEHYYMPLISSDDSSKDNRIKHSRKTLDEGGFAYMYKRTNPSSIKYDLHPYLEHFFTPDFCQYLTQITGYNNLFTNIGDTFVSCYTSGDFNGPHTDGDNGRLAFVYHLSKNWKVENGGLFFRMEEDFHTVNKVVVPPFNSLTIFDTKGQGTSGTPHLVTEVAQACTNKRIGFTGWYQ
jgi:hypothetical protein|tara:strand:+ start:491 stop:1183 length:693 start_codon:yes stop_codon:yes gene_type:complete